MVASWITAKARKGDSSGIAGRGLHAVEPIAAGELVAVKGGHILTTAALRELPEPLPNSEIQITDDLHLAVLIEAEYEPVMLFLNHSCEPNVGFAGNTILVTMRAVAAGEELTTDYTLFDNHTPIDPRRLLALARASTCVDCQDKDKATRGRPGRRSAGGSSPGGWPR